MSVIVLCGALGVISSTQTWLNATLADGAGHVLAVAGADALRVLAPLSLSILALGGALSIVGRVLRYVFGALATVIAVVLAVLTAQIAFAAPVTAVATQVTEATGITGEKGVAALVALIVPTPWPALTLIVWIVLIGASVFALLTAHRWGGAGRRYRTSTDAPASATGAAGSRPHDAIDSWDDLSRGEDPTTRPLD